MSSWVAGARARGATEIVGLEGVLDGDDGGRGAVARAVRIPVIAAGGIADSKGVAAAMALGAAGVQVGTSYLLCPECNTSPLHRAALKGDAARHTAVTNVFTGRPARAIVNRFVRELGPVSEDAQAGRADFSPMWAGQNASGCKELPAAQITQALGDLRTT